MPLSRSDEPSCIFYSMASAAPTLICAALSQNLSSQLSASSRQALVVKSRPHSCLADAELSPGCPLALATRKAPFPVLVDVL